MHEEAMLVEVTSNIPRFARHISRTLSHIVCYPDNLDYISDDIKVGMIMELGVLSKAIDEVMPMFIKSVPPEELITKLLTSIVEALPSD